MTLSISERVSLVLKAITLLPGRLFLYVLRAVALAVVWRMNIKHVITCAFIKAAFTTFSPRQIQHVVPSTRQAYQKFLLQKANQHPGGTLGISFTQDIEPLDESGAALLWLGDRKKATKIVYFLHGGGFFVPLAPGHIRWCWDLYVKPGVAAGIDVACAILEYTLSPEAKYPSHLKQASAGLQAILDAGFSARDIIIGGDSAGANLTMQLLLHIKHPQPQVKRLTLDAPLPATFLVSAYLTFRAAHLPSFEKYARVDLSPGRSRVDYLQRQVSGTDSPISELHSKYWWSTPLDADPNKFNSLDDVVRHMYIAYGECEVLGDHSLKLVALLTEHAPGLNIVVEIGDKEPHDTVILEEMTQQLDGPASSRIQRWFTRLLEGDFDTSGETVKQEK